MQQDNLSEKFLTEKRSGLLVPLFSVYSKNSFGIGDLSDLRKVIDLARKTGNSVLQLLPMNEMGPLFCPYDSLSSFALEPLYISLEDLSLPKGKSIKRQINSVRENLPKLSGYVDYSVKAEKMRILREVFLLQDLSGAKEFDLFKEANIYWLKDFSLFKVIKDEHKGLAWYDWPVELKERDKNALKDFSARHKQEILFQEWLQWQLYVQFKAVKHYSKLKKVFLKGDLPILVSRDSSDVWAHREFFKLEFAAGAPPDMYSALGQRWGMPTYNWGKISEDNYKYLKEKLRYAQNFYDLLRVDHVVGLFRIWSIPYNEPLENKGLNGFFDPPDESRWYAHGREILEVMSGCTNMFLCAEDLGVIPEACTRALRELEIPGNDVMRWVKDWCNRHDFLRPQEYRRLSVAMLSTHDTTNWPAWWENEAGTVDEALFIRKCSDHRHIGFDRVKDKLFDFSRSGHGRLRWRDDIGSVDKLFDILSLNGSIPKEHLGDFADLYLNTYGEKEKLWNHLGLRGFMREKCDKEIMCAALEFVLSAESILCINNIFDVLYVSGLLKGDSYDYRINTPGSISDKNWSLLLPLPLEDILTMDISCANR